MQFSFLLGYLLIPYAAVVVIAWGYGAFTLHHLSKHGATPVVNVTTSFLYYLVLLVIIGGTFTVLRDVDWRATTTIAPPSVNLTLPGFPQQ